MGSFTASLLNNLVAHSLEMTWIVNKRLAPLSDEDMLLAKRLKARVIELDLLHKGDNELFAESRETNRERIDAAMASLLTKYDKVTYFLPALFSSEVHPVFPTRGTTNVQLFHDVIPFLYYKHYFKDHEGLARKDYAQRFSEFYNTDLFVTNSQTTADDLVVYFGVDAERTAPIMGAAADRSQLKPSRPHGVDEEFVFMPSGDDFRKNNIRAVQAFAALNTTTKLVITSHFSEGSRRELRAIYPHIVFTGSVSNEEFLWLLDNAKIVFFPPEYEGLGMPMIEAVQRNAVVACSNIPVFAEISREAFFYFNPKSVNDMTVVLQKAIKADKQKYIKSVAAEYSRILTTFSWEKVAETFVGSLEVTPDKVDKKRLAVFCPSPSSYSAVGKYAFQNHAELSRYFEIDYYAENGITVFEATRPNILDGAVNYYSASEFDINKSQQYDQILYHIGNSEFHIDTILNSLRLSANAIIHDTSLMNIFDWLQHQGFITADRRALEAKLDTMYGTENTRDLTSIATNQKLLVAHSEYAENALTSAYGGLVKQVKFPMGVPEIQIEKTGKPVVSFAGIISEDKGIGLVADIAKNRSVDVNIFGFGVLGDSPLLKDLGDNVRVSKDLTDKEFQDMLKDTSVLVNYRPNYHGETSMTTLEAMRHGVVVIVKDIGWYSELPDDTVVKVKSESEVLPAIEKLLSGKSDIRKIRNAARAFLKQEHNYKKYAEFMYENLV